MELTVMVALLDEAERQHASPTSRPVASLVALARAPRELLAARPRPGTMPLTPLRLEVLVSGVWRLEQLDGVASRVVQQDLLATEPRHDVVAELHPCLT